MLNKWEGIVLRSIPYGETHKIVTLFTKEAGKLTAMARGAKKPASRLAAITQTFTHGSFLIRTGRGMGTLDQGEQIDSMRHIREDLEATAYASYIVELIDRLTEDNKQGHGLYGLLYDALHAINEQYDPEAISLFVEWKMLPVAGIHPILHQCANCGAAEGEFAFSFKEIGFLCHRCFHMDRYLVRLSPTQLKLIRTFYTVPISSIGNLTLKMTTKQFMKKIVRTIYDEQVGLRLKSRSFLDQLESTPELLPKKEKPVVEGD
ncbi:DNA repair protein RecO [Sporosarcina limicola]|uniref:DNA repair protein RecO n=1 Tax=Sporosarcina limicola TaxID=34101 RepID=A0A927MM37_9BACL|nr:DNA repair protein RecO [Sporosarcina limicola]MBE1553721.1 DNA repair protein RecO (recombination protein O) [Sporosarcina limicola]